MIQLRSAAHLELSNILSAQPKNYNRTLWEALIQSTVTMLSETKSAACSQHISSFTSIALSLFLFWPLSVLPLQQSLFLSSIPISGTLSFSLCCWISRNIYQGNLLYRTTWQEHSNKIWSVDLVQLAMSFRNYIKDDHCFCEFIFDKVLVFNVK